MATLCLAIPRFLEKCNFATLNFISSETIKARKMENIALSSIRMQKKIREACSTKGTTRRISQQSMNFSTQHSFQNLDIHQNFSLAKSYKDPLDNCRAKSKL